MSIDTSDRKAKNYVLRRSILDIGMGLIIMGFGVFFGIAHKFGIEFTITPEFRYAFVVLCVVYGGFRVYRGYKKNYFSE
jgi:phage shock protein PspC (stress-responsive transcriptional regulator)